MPDLLIQHYSSRPYVVIAPMSRDGSKFIREYLKDGPMPRVSTEGMIDVSRLIIEKGLTIVER